MPCGGSPPGNTLGGILAAALVAVVAYKFGEAAAEAIDNTGLDGGIVAAVVAAIACAAFRFWKKRVLEKPETRAFAQIHPVRQPTTVFSDMFFFP